METSSTKAMDELILLHSFSQFITPGHFLYGLPHFSVASITFVLSPRNTLLNVDWFKEEAGREERTNSIQPLGRIGQPSEVAKVVTFLLSSKSTYVSGSDWAVDGGLGARSA